MSCQLPLWINRSTVGEWSLASAWRSASLRPGVRYHVQSGLPTIGAFPAAWSRNFQSCPRCAMTDQPLPPAPEDSTAIQATPGELPQSGNAEQLPEAPRLQLALPGPGLWRATGWVVSLLVLQVVGILGLALLWALLGQSLGPALVLPVNGLMIVVFTIWLVLYHYGHEAPRVLALRGLSRFQLALVVLLATPLVLVVNEVAVSANGLLWTATESPETPVFSQDRIPWQLLWLERDYHLLAQMPWLVGFVAFCRVLPASV